MAEIDQLLTQILNTKLGKDMRQAIHDSISQCYDDVTSPELLPNYVQNGSSALL